MDQKRQFLERKGLTEAEIAEAVRRVPAEPAAPAQPSTSGAVVPAQPAQPPAYYGQAPPAQQQLVPAGPPQPQPVRWSHALLGAAFVAAGAYALKVLLWPYVQDAVAKWRASQHAAEERAAQQAQRTEALAEAIREQTSELRGTVELLQKLTSTLEQTQAAAQRDAEARLRAPESVTLADLRAELRTLATTLRYDMVLCKVPDICVWVEAISGGDYDSDVTDIHTLLSTLQIQQRRRPRRRGPQV